MPLRFTVSSPAALRRLAMLSLFVLLGCGPAEQVNKYTAPKDPVDTDSISDEPGEGEPTVRILGAIAPAGKPGEKDSWYFFKFQPASMGETYPPKAIERHAAAFDEFIRSLKFNQEGPPSWTVPAGWMEVGSQNKDRIVTFRMKKSATPVQLAVTQFGGSLLENINRWRVQQAGVDAITEAEIDTKCRVETVDGRKIVIVDVSGSGGGKGRMRPPVAK
jgi:hypothetical protein